MAKLINGTGNKAIWAHQDADLITALAGNVTGIAKVGNKFAATQEDANTIGLSDGVIVTKEGRRIQLDVGSVDLFDIPTGTAGVTSYYIIGYHLITNSDSSQECETFVQKMDNATDVITENTFRGGATEVYVSCYRVVQDGLNIDSINALLPELGDISSLQSALTVNNNGFYFDYQNGKYGYNTDPSRGAGTFSPFNSNHKITIPLLQHSPALSGASYIWTNFEIGITDYSSVKIGSVSTTSYTNVYIIGTKNGIDTTLATLQSGSNLSYDISEYDILKIRLQVRNDGTATVTDIVIE